MQDFSLVNIQSTNIFRIDIQRQSFNGFMILSRKRNKKHESSRNI